MSCINIKGSLKGETRRTEITVGEGDVALDEPTANIRFRNPQCSGYVALGDFQVARHHRQKREAVQCSRVCGLFGKNLLKISLSIVELAHSKQRLSAEQQGLGVVHCGSGESRENLVVRALQEFRSQQF